MTAEAVRVRSNSSQVVLVRHARFIGRGEGVRGPDPALSPTGLLQAELLRSRLEPERFHWDRVISSPLTRAHQTATIATTGWTQRIEVLEELSEVDAGLASPDLDPELWKQHWNGGDWIGFPGGETREEFRARVSGVIAQLRERRARYLIFSHQLFIEELLSQVLRLRTGTNAPRTWITMCSLSKIVLGERDHLVFLNDTAHLSENYTPVLP